MEDSKTNIRKPNNADYSKKRTKSFIPESWADYQRSSSRGSILKELECTSDDDVCLFMKSTKVIDFTEKPLQTFCTGSKYLGQWNELGIAGKGIYKYPHGVIYDGHFNKDGQFHGVGTLIYPNGDKVNGIWRNGVLNTEDMHFITSGEIHLTEQYCTMPDRRFQIELENDLNPVGLEYLTNKPQPPKDIPDDCYDLVDSYFNPKYHAVFAYPPDTFEPQKTVAKERDTERIKLEASTANVGKLTSEVKKQTEEAVKMVMWIPKTTEAEWIKNNCRKAWDAPTGYRPDLYETWTKGGDEVAFAVGEDVPKPKLPFSRLDKTALVKDKIPLMFVHTMKSNRKNAPAADVTKE